jgi:serine/threonine protein kinase
MLRVCTLSIIERLPECQNARSALNSRAVQDLRAQLQKDVKILMDATKARSALNTPMDGVVAFEGAFMDMSTQEASVVLEYMNGGSLEDVIKEV